MTLALLLTAVTGAWATEFTSLKVGDVLHVGDVINTSTNYSFCGRTLGANFQPATLVRANTSSWDITESETGAYYLLKDQNGTYYGYILGPMGFEGGYWPVTDTSDGISVTAITPDGYTELTFAVHEGTAEPPLTVEWDASTKTGTFAMPGSDVVLTPIYAKAAAFATTGTEPEVKTLLPEAAEGVIAGTDASLIAEGTGIVAFAGTSTEVTQGTLMYAIGTSATQAPALTAFNATVPTAKDIADDGATVYVWYYIQGADAPDGVAATLDNTFDDSEICAEPIKVTVLTNKFDIQFNAANANTIEAGNATVTVGGTDKTGDITEGKLQGVKMGSEVKVKANTGYKFRKVEVKKKAAAPTTITVTWNGADITGTGGGKSFTKDGVTITADDIEFMDKNFIGGGTFTTTLGNFTKIEVTTDGWYASGTGWSGSTWTGNASSVSFSGEIMGYGGDNLKFVFTIEPTN